MSNCEVKMKTNKEITKILKLSQEIVEEANIGDKYKQIAFSKVFDIMARRLDRGDTNMGQTDFSDKKSSATAEIINSSKTFAGFLRQTTAKSHAHNVLCAAYYFLKHDKMTFTKEDIESAYQSAFLPKSKNTSADINSLIKQGLVMSTKEKVGGKTSYQITMDGINFVEEKLKETGKK